MMGDMSFVEEQARREVMAGRKLWRVFKWLFIVWLGFLGVVFVGVSAGDLSLIGVGLVFIAASFYLGFRIWRHKIKTTP
jgi:hypothetical protein